MAEKEIKEKEDEELNNPMKVSLTSQLHVSTSLLNVYYITATHINIIV